jgi:hypothetical protein
MAGQPKNSALKAFKISKVELLSTILPLTTGSPTEPVPLQLLTSNCSVEVISKDNAQLLTQFDEKDYQIKNQIYIW